MIIYFDLDKNIIILDGIDKIFTPRSLNAISSGNIINIFFNNTKIVSKNYKKIRREDGTQYGSVSECINSLNEIFNFKKRIDFTHIQTLPSNIWVVNHNLGFFPSVQVTDTSNSEIEGMVIHNNINTTTLKFSASFAGKARFN